MADSVDFTKTSDEKLAITIDFSARWPTGATEISSATYAAYKYRFPSGERTLATSTVLVSPTASIVDSKKAKVTVQAGSTGNAYLLLCTATLDEGSILQHGVIMLVKDF